MLPTCPPAFLADEQVGRLLAALNISPDALPAEAPGLASNWDSIYAAAAPRLAQPSAAAEHAAAAAMASAAQQQQQQQWAQEFERLRLGEPGPSSSAAWAAEYQQQQQQAQPSGWADEFAQAEGVESVAEGSSWVNEFRSTAAAGSAMRQQAAGDALEQTRKLADTLAGGCGAGGWIGGATARGCSCLRQHSTAAHDRPALATCADTELPSRPSPPCPLPCCSQQRPQDPQLQVPAVCVQDEPRGADHGGQPGGSRGGVSWMQNLGM